MRKALALLFILAVSMTFAQHPLDVLVRSRGEPRYELILERVSQEGDKIFVMKVFGLDWLGLGWFHRVGVILPNNLRSHEKAFLLIAGGSRRVEDQSYYESFLDEMMQYLEIARKFEAPFVVVADVPNQPIWGLREDALISETFKLFLEKREKDLPLLVPMTYGVIKAMDAVQDFLARKGANVKYFMVSGASKRGWTAYLTAAFDSRVFAIAPMVFDNLNIKAQLEQQRRYYNGFSEKLKDYSERGLLEHPSDEASTELLEMVDPYALRLRLSLPKILVLATNDEYWTVDSANLYLDQLPGETYLFYSSNDRHELKNVAEIVQTVSSFFKLYPNFPKPSFEYSGYEIRVRKEEGMVGAEVWFARSRSLDFRSSVWLKLGVHEEDGVYVGRPPSKPEGTHQAFFMRVLYELNGERFYLCSRMVVD